MNLRSTGESVNPNELKIYTVATTADVFAEKPPRQLNGTASDTTEEGTIVV